MKQFKRRAARSHGSFRALPRPRVLDGASLGSGLRNERYVVFYPSGTDADVADLLAAIPQLRALGAYVSLIWVVLDHPAVMGDAETFAGNALAISDAYRDAGLHIIIGWLPESDFAYRQLAITDATLKQQLCTNYGSMGVAQGLVQGYVDILVGNYGEPFQERVFEDWENLLYVPCLRLGSVWEDSANRLAFLGHLRTAQEGWGQSWIGYPFGLRRNAPNVPAFDVLMRDALPSLDLMAVAMDVVLLDPEPWTDPSVDANARAGESRLVESAALLPHGRVYAGLANNVTLPAPFGFSYDRALVYSAGVERGVWIWAGSVALRLWLGLPVTLAPPRAPEPSRAIWLDSLTAPTRFYLPFTQDLADAGLVGDELTLQLATGAQFRSNGIAAIGATLQGELRSVPTTLDNTGTGGLRHVYGRLVAGAAAQNPGVSVHTAVRLPLGLRPAALSGTWNAGAGQLTVLFNQPVFARNPTLGLTFYTGTARYTIAAPASGSGTPSVVFNMGGGLANATARHAQILNNVGTLSNAEFLEVADNPNIPVP